MPGIQISRGYLNLSRKFAKMIESLDTEDKTEDEIATIKFSLYSGTIIYAYSTIDAFTNRFLLDSWNESKKLDFPRTVTRGFNIDALTELKEKTANIEEFKQFKGTKYAEVKERVKFLSKVASIKGIHEVDSTLWENLLKVLRDQRNFFVHVDSSEKFDQEVTKVFETENPNIYHETATSVLTHFYVQKGRKVPKYLIADDLI